MVRHVHVQLGALPSGRPQTRTLFRAMAKSCTPLPVVCLHPSEEWIHLLGAKIAMFYANDTLGSSGLVPILGTGDPNMDRILIAEDVDNHKFIPVA